MFVKLQTDHLTQFVHKPYQTEASPKVLTIILLNVLSLHLLFRSETYYLIRSRNAIYNTIILLLFD